MASSAGAAAASAAVAAAPIAAAAPTPPAAGAGASASKHEAPAAAAALLLPSSLQDGLRSDAVALHACAFLPARDLTCLALTASYWRGLLLGAGAAATAKEEAGRVLLWREALRHEENGPGLLRRLEHQTTLVAAATAAAAATTPAKGPMPTAPVLVAACGRAHRLSRLGAGAGAPPVVRWAEVPAALAGTGGRWPIRAMEGHAAALLDDRWMVVVGGFGMRGVENEVYVLDTWALPGEGEEENGINLHHHQQQQPPPPAPQPGRGWGTLASVVAAAKASAASGPAPGPAAAWWRLADRSQRPYPPLYGHACAALGPRRLAVFGGCTMGGYGGDVNDLYILDLEIDAAVAAAAISPFGSHHRGGVGGGCPVRLGGAVTWRRVHALGQPLTSRAYCTLTPLPDPGSGAVRRLLVLGGIHEGRATLDLEIVEIKEDDGDGGDGLVVEVVKPAPAAMGPRPAVRMGHSCTLLPPQPQDDDGGSSSSDSSGSGPCQRWRLLVLGGSDGSDLLRNGDEHADAWRLDIVGGGSGGSGPPRVEWSQPPLPRPIPWWFPMGRTHTAQHVGGGVVLCFGGGAGLSNRLGLVDTTTWAFSSPRLLPPTTANNPAPRPRPRLSHVAVRSGTRLLVHGGWNGRELGDLFALDLAPLWRPPASDDAAATAAATAATLHGGGDDDEEEVWEEEGEEDAAAAGRGVRRVECAQS